MIEFIVGLVVGALAGGYGGHKLGRRAEAKAREIAKRAGFGNS